MAYFREVAYIEAKRQLEAYMQEHPDDKFPVKACCAPWEHETKKVFIRAGRNLGLDARIIYGHGYENGFRIF